MRKLEGVVKEIVDALGYLQKRESKMQDTNGESPGLCMGSIHVAGVDTDFGILQNPPTAGCRISRF